MLRRGSYDYWGCYANYDHETADEARVRRHKTGECNPKTCEDCLNEASNDNAGRKVLSKV